MCMWVVRRGVCGMVRMMVRGRLPWGLLPISLASSMLHSRGIVRQQQVSQKKLSIFHQQTTSILDKYPRPQQFPLVLSFMLLGWLR